VKKISSLEYDIPDEFTERSNHAVMVASPWRLTKKSRCVAGFYNFTMPKKLTLPF